MEINRGYSIRGKSRGKLRHWSGMIEEWLLNIERYGRVTDGDVPYWYNERANVSVLAGAAWRCGWVALEEFQTEKQEPVPEEGDVIDAKRWKGRCDLFICSDRRSDTIEAKFKWLSLNSKDIEGQSSQLLDKALSDAHNTSCGENIYAVGVAFIPFYIKESALFRDIDEQIDEALDEMKKTGADLIAWCFPEFMRDKVSEKGYIHPGVVMLAKLV
jgi:hypothetical protein